VVGNDPRRSVALWCDGRRPAGGRLHTRTPHRPGGAGRRLHRLVSGLPRIALHASDAGAAYEFWTYDIYWSTWPGGRRRRSEHPGADFFPVLVAGRSSYRLSHLRDPALATSTRYALQGVLSRRPRRRRSSPRILNGGVRRATHALVLELPEGSTLFRDASAPSQHLFRVDPATGAMERVTEPATSSLSFAFSFTPGRALGRLRRAADATHYQEIFVYPPGAATASLRRLTSFRRAAGRLDPGRAGSFFTMDLRNDGTKPSWGCSSSRTASTRSSAHPLVVIVHGGSGGRRPGDDRPRPALLPDGMYAAHGWRSCSATNYPGLGGVTAVAFRAASPAATASRSTRTIVSGDGSPDRAGHWWTPRLQVTPSRGPLGWSHGRVPARPSRPPTGSVPRRCPPGAGVSDLQDVSHAGSGTHDPSQQRRAGQPGMLPSTLSRGVAPGRT
jgi:hypothetical protein